MPPRSCRALGLRAQVDQRAGHQLERALQRLVPRGSHSAASLLKALS